MPEITLDQLLQSRDKRAGFQRELAASFKLPLVSFTVNTPGPAKRGARADFIFESGVIALRERLAGSVIYSKLRHLPTGCEGFFVVESNAARLKKIAVEIEQTHGLGRLFDIDVIVPDGMHISRESIGLPPRKCLICSGDAAACVRSRAHALEELQSEIDRIIARYKSKEVHDGGKL